MTQEEKAKVYDEALSRAKECHNDGLSLHKIKDSDVLYWMNLSELEK